MSKIDCFLLGQQSQSCCTITKINANKKTGPGIHGQKPRRHENGGQQHTVKIRCYLGNYTLKFILYLLAIHILEIHSFKAGRKRIFSAAVYSSYCAYLSKMITLSYQKKPNPKQTTTNLKFSAALPARTAFKGGLADMETCTYEGVYRAHSVSEDSDILLSQ